MKRYIDRESEEHNTLDLIYSVNQVVQHHLEGYVKAKEFVRNGDNAIARQSISFLLHPIFRSEEEKKEYFQQLSSKILSLGFPNGAKDLQPILFLYETAYNKIKEKFRLVLEDNFEQFLKRQDFSPFLARQTLKIIQFMDDNEIIKKNAMRSLKYPQTERLKDQIENTVCVIGKLVPSKFVKIMTKMSLIKNRITASIYESVLDLCKDEPSDILLNRFIDGIVANICQGDWLEVNGRHRFDSKLNDEGRPFLIENVLTEEEMGPLKFEENLSLLLSKIPGYFIRRRFNQISYQIDQVEARFCQNVLKHLKGIGISLWDSLDLILKLTGLPALSSYLLHRYYYQPLANRIVRDMSHPINISLIFHVLDKVLEKLEERRNII